MNVSEKAVVIGVISFIVFGFVNLYLGGFINAALGGGDAYFYPVYAGVTMLCSLVVSCTYIIVKKINVLLDEIKGLKESK